MKTVVVLSLPRSGSSLLAGVLFRLGVQMGSVEGLLKGNHVNKYGNYENQEFFKLNIDILSHADSFSLSWADIPEDEKVKKRVEFFEPWINYTIHKNERELWGWKDATNIYTLPHFEKYLTNPYYIVLKRDVESVVKSHLKAAKISEWHKTIIYFSKYFNLRMLFSLGWRIFKQFIHKGNVFNDEERYRNVILEGYSRMDEFVKGKRHIYIEFFDLIKKPQYIINLIVDFLNINPSIVQFQKAIAFIDHDQVHFQRKHKHTFDHEKELILKAIA